MTEGILAYSIFFINSANRFDVGPKLTLPTEQTASCQEMGMHILRGFPIGNL
jgi:hypothetical protein